MTTLYGDGSLDDGSTLWGDGSYEAESTESAPELDGSSWYAGYIGSDFSVVLAYSGGAPTSWAISGGDDSASYSVSDSGVLSRLSQNDTEETENVIVTATNDIGTSGEMTVYVAYSEVVEDTGRKRKKRMIRNFFYYGKEFKRAN